MTTQRTIVLNDHLADLHSRMLRPQVLQLAHTLVPPSQATPSARMLLPCCRGAPSCKVRLLSTSRLDRQQAHNHYCMPCNKLRGPMGAGRPRVLGNHP